MEEFNSNNEGFGYNYLIAVGQAETLLDKIKRINEDKYNVMIAKSNEYEVTELDFKMIFCASMRHPVNLIALTILECSDEFKDLDCNFRRAINTFYSNPETRKYSKFMKDCVIVNPRTNDIELDEICKMHYYSLASSYPLLEQIQQVNDTHFLQEFIANKHIALGIEKGAKINNSYSIRLDITEVIKANKIKKNL